MVVRWSPVGGYTCINVQYFCKTE